MYEGIFTPEQQRELHAGFMAAQIVLTTKNLLPHAKKVYLEIFLRSLKPEIAQRISEDENMEPLVKEIWMAITKDQIQSN